MEDNKKTSILETIKKGEVYAIIKSVSNSGMSRRICFYRINKTEDIKGYEKGRLYIENITEEIGELSEELKKGQQKQGNRWVSQDGLRVSGCGMDMVFATLHNCLGEEAEKWSGKYNLL